MAKSNNSINFAAATNTSFGIGVTTPPSLPLLISSTGTTNISSSFINLLNLVASGTQGSTFSSLRFSDNSSTLKSSVDGGAVSNSDLRFTNLPVTTTLVGTGASGNADQGFSAAISADGNTVASGGESDASGIGAVWIFVRSSSVWAQQGLKLVGTGSTSGANQGDSVSLSADGNTLAVGGPNDDNGASGSGATWIFTRSATGTWSQQGAKLIGTGGTNSAQGGSVSLSADGNTLAVGGHGDASNLGAAWVFTRTGSTWTQQGAKLVGSGAVGTNGSHEGTSVSLSADGNTLAVGGPFDNGGGLGSGATWIFTRSATATWSQQAKLIGTGLSGTSNHQGISVSISADSNTVAVGGDGDSFARGAVWIFVRSNGSWTQQGPKLVGTGFNGTSTQGTSVSLSASGNNLVVGGEGDGASNNGAVWLFHRSGTTWTQIGTKLTSISGFFGSSVAISSQANTFVVGANSNSAHSGAALIYEKGYLPKLPDTTTGLVEQVRINRLGQLSVGAINPDADFQVGAPTGTGYTNSLDASKVLLFGAQSTFPSTHYSVLTVVDNAGTAYQDNGGGITLAGRLSDAGSISAFGRIRGSKDTAIDNTALGKLTFEYLNSLGLTEGARLDSNGFFGIGTSTPTVRLAVNNGTQSITNTGTSNASSGFLNIINTVASGTQGSTFSSIQFSDNSSTLKSSVDGGAVSNSDLRFTNLPVTTTLVGTGAGAGSNQGSSLAISADGDTVAEGGRSDFVSGQSIGAVWVFTRSSGTWTQQGLKLTGTGAVASSTGPFQGTSVSLSADGNTLAFGGPGDNSAVGATWVFTRSSGTWTQQGLKLTGTGGTGSGATGPLQGTSVSLSADGNTLAFGGPGDNNNVGATWIFTRSSGTWTQQGLKLTGTGGTGSGATGPLQGFSVALSADGNTLAVGGRGDNNNVGAVWVFTRSSGTWTQQGLKLTGTGGTGSGATGPFQGTSVSLSADGNTLAVGGSGDNNDSGAVWIFTRSSGTWTQQGTKLSGSGKFGFSTCLSADGNDLIVGGPAVLPGAAWLFHRSGTSWMQIGNALMTITGQFGYSVIISAQANTWVIGAPINGAGSAGAILVYEKGYLPKLPDATTGLVEQVRINRMGQLSVGVVNPDADFQVGAPTGTGYTNSLDASKVLLFGAQSTIPSTQYSVLTVVDNAGTSYQDNGGGITLAGRLSDAGSISAFGRIRGSKATATDNTALGKLTFEFLNALGLTEGARLDSNGLTLATPLAAGSGGTGVANSNTITLGGNISTAGALTLSGAFGATFTFTGTTSVTFPVSGTLLSTTNASGNYVSSITGTANQVIASAATGAVTLSLPQNIATTSSPTFGGININGTSVFRPTASAGAFQFDYLSSGTLASNQIARFGVTGSTNGFTITQTAGSVLEYTFNAGNTLLLGDTTIGLNTGSQLTLNAVTTTVANSGGTAPPANVQGFIDVIINGTHRKIPYYLN